MPHGPAITIGAEIRGFRIERELGRGGMGVVYLAQQLNLDRKVALKVMTPDLSADPGFVERFTREARLAASLDHPNVVPVFETGSVDGLLYLAMRYVPGTDLRAVLGTQGALPLDHASRITDQVGAALDAAHARGLVHRDVKPANVLLTREDAEGHVYLADFGLTKEMDAQSGGLTKTGQFVGTLDYVAPEQIEAHAVDARADVYALGCVLFQMAAGRVPFQGSEPHKLYAHLSESPPLLGELGIQGGERLDAVIQRAMAKDPARRYPSAGDLGRAALAASADTPISVPERSVASGEAAPPTKPAQPATSPLPPPAPTAPTAPMRKSRSLSSGVGVLLAGLLLAGAILGGALIVTSRRSASRSSSAGSSAREKGSSGSSRGTTSTGSSGTGGGGTRTLARWPSGQSGFTVILASKTSRSEAEAAARRAPGNRSPGVLRSDDYPSLNPGYWVAFSGRFTAAVDAQTAAQSLRSQFSDAYVRYVDPKGASASAAASTLSLSRFNTGTDAGQSVAAAYCESSPARLYCWTPNDGFTLALDDTGAHRVRGDQAANKNRTPSYETLARGLRNRRAGITCSSEASGLTCRNDAGSGFSLPRYRGLPTYY